VSKQQVQRTTTNDMRQITIRLGFFLCHTAEIQHVQTFITTTTNIK